jgi:hypothetical protein
MKYRVLKKGNEHAIQIKKWYGWANYLVYSDTSVGPNWLVPKQWYKAPVEELLEDMKYNFRGQAEVQVVSEGEL